MPDEHAWCDDPQELARLWRWLESTAITNDHWSDPAYFMENAHKWAEEREQMVREQGRVTTT